MPNKRSAVILTFFVLGACSITCQAALVREFLTVFSGNELILGALFGIWLMWISLGAAVGSLLSRWRAGLVPFFIIGVLVAGAAPLGQVFAIRYVRVIYQMPPGLLLGFQQMLKFTLACLAPFCFMIGFTFPIGCRIFADPSEHKAAGIGWVYTAECVGFLCGGVLFSFVLVYCYNAMLIAAGLLLLAVLASLFVVAQGAGRKMCIACSAVALAAVVAWLGLSPTVRSLDRKTIERRWDELKTGATLLRSVDSKYENLVLGEREGQYEVFASGSAAFHFPDKYEFPVVANYVAAQHPDPKSILIVGHATHGLIREFLTAGLQRVDHVELDPQVSDLIRPYLPAEDQAVLKSDKVHPHYGDGRHYVKTCKEQYDIAFVNLADPSTAMLNRYYTREFFHELKRILRPGAVAAITTSCSYSYIGDILGDFSASIFHTFRSEFPYVVITPQDHAYIFGSTEPGVVTDDAEDLAESFREKNLQLETFTEHHFAMLFPSTTTDQLWDEMMARAPIGFPPPKEPEGEEEDDPLFKKPQTDEAERKPAKFNTDLKPVSYFYNLLLWDKYTSSNLYGFFRGVERIRPSLLIACLAALLLLRMAYVLVFRRSEDSQIRFNALASITICGFSAMAIDILMLFAYQNLFGYLYHMVGLLIALFMLGLALGATFMNLGLRRVTKGTKTLIGLQTGLVVYAFALPALIPLVGHVLSVSVVLGQIVFMALVVLAGLIAGAQFPLCGKLYLDRSSGIGVASGLVDAGDHFGACVGALASGSVFMPVLGVVATCVLIGVLNVACMVLVLFTGMRRVV